MSAADKEARMSGTWRMSSGELETMTYRLNTLDADNRRKDERIAELQRELVTLRSELYQHRSEASIAYR